MEKVIERFERYMQHRGLRDAQVHRECGLANGTLGQARKDGRDLGKKAIESILSRYTDLNRVWLITGEGEMEATAKAVETRPRLPINTKGGQNEILDGVELAQCEQVPVVPMFPHYTFTMRVTGDSMAPYINSGDEVACLKIEESSFLQWGRIYVLFTSQGVIIKKIYEEGDGIRCVSLNEDNPDFIVPKREIYSFNLVIGLVRICN